MKKLHLFSVIIIFLLSICPIPYGSIPAFSAETSFSDNFDSYTAGDNQTALSKWTSVSPQIDIMADPRTGHTGNILKAYGENAIIYRDGVDLSGDHDINFELFQAIPSGKTWNAFQKVTVIPNPESPTGLGWNDWIFDAASANTGKIYLCQYIPTGYTMPTTAATDRTDPTKWKSYRLEARGIGTSTANLTLYIDDVKVYGPISDASTGYADRPALNSGTLLKRSGYNNARFQLYLGAWSNEGDKNILIDNITIDAPPVATPTPTPTATPTLTPTPTSTPTPTPPSGAEVFEDDFESYTIGNGQTVATAFSKWTAASSTGTANIVADPRSGKTGKVLQVTSSAPTLSKSGLNLSGDFELSFDMFLKRSASNAAIETGAWQDLFIYPANYTAVDSYFRRFLTYTNANADIWLNNNVASGATVPVANDAADPAQWHNYRLSVSKMGLAGATITLYIDGVQKGNPITTTNNWVIGAGAGDYTNSTIKFKPQAWVSSDPSKSVLIDNFKIGYYTDFVMPAHPIFTDNFNAQSISSYGAAPKTVLPGWDGMWGGDLNATVNYFQIISANTHDRYLSCIQAEQYLSKRFNALPDQYGNKYVDFKFRLTGNYGSGKFMIQPDSTNNLTPLVSSGTRWTSSLPLMIWQNNTSNFKYHIFNPSEDYSNAETIFNQGQWYRIKFCFKSFGTSANETLMFVDDKLIYAIPGNTRFAYNLATYQDSAFIISPRQTSTGSAADFDNFRIYSDALPDCSVVSTNYLVNSAEISSLQANSNIDVSASVNVNAKTLPSENAVLVASLYNAQNSVLTTSSQQFSIKHRGNKNPSVTIATPANVGGCKLKVTVLYTDSNMSPVPFENGVLSEIN